LVHDPDLDRLGTGKVTANITLRKQENTLISLPNCFGFRQKTDSGLAFLIGELLAGRPIKWARSPSSWAYAEDVASLVWFVIENDITSEISMPVLGTICIGEIADILAEIFEVKPVIHNSSEPFEGLDAFSDKDSIWIGMASAYMETTGDTTGKTTGKIGKWVPDSSNLRDAIIKTARWYKANRWAL
jgi:nucleoside-diphosphate-sugar epimerase